ncbi:MAG: ABC transporter ATP-binding protein [Deltaproteobacteria bacterium]|nr:ABC transporter ATP-binding protein [Deltaproteobacteria bacterium]
MAIKIESLTKTFRTGLRRKLTRALCGLDLEVARGEVFGFLGPNGAGKTTAIKILVGLLKQNSGQAYLLGRSIHDPQARQKVAYLPEMPDFYDYLNPIEFLKHCGRLSGLSNQQLIKKTPELLEKVGLNPAEKRPLRKFSKGMLQRVGIAQTMLADPELYILDEPMGGLDPLGRRWVKKLILDLGQAGKTIFFSSHILAEAEAVCDRVAFLQHGRLIAQGSLSEILQTHTGNWEILVAGQQVKKDEKIMAFTSSFRHAAQDTILIPAAEIEMKQLLEALLAKDYQVQSVNQHHASLEEVFIQTIDSKQASKEN